MDAMKHLLLTSLSAVALALASAGPGNAQTASAEVQQAQQQLRSEGLYNGRVDGVMGPDTTQALRQYQQRHGLKETGNLDQETLAGLTGKQAPPAASGAPPAPAGKEAAAASAGAEARPGACPVGHDQLVQALRQSVKPAGGPGNGGMDTNEWAAVVDRDGKVCAVAYSGRKAGDQWPGSRAIAVEKASTANAFSLDSYAISTANLWAPAQPGGFLYGVAASQPPVGQELMAGEPSTYGTASDPLVGKRPGGTVVFAGGLALYDGKGVVGGLGASGDTSCADHNIAWRLRQKLGLDKVPNGPSPKHNDEIVYDVGPDGVSQSGWGHPGCGHSGARVAQQIGAGVASPQAAGQAPGMRKSPAAHPSAQEQQTLPRFLHGQ